MGLLFDNRQLKINADTVERIVLELHECAAHVRVNPNQVQYNLCILARNLSEELADQNNCARAHQAVRS